MPDFLLLRLQFFESCKLLWWVQRDLGLYAAGKDIWSSNQHMLIWKKNLQNSVINVHRKYTNKFAFKSLKENLEFRFKLELTMFSHAMKILWSWNCLRRQIYRSWQFSVPQPDRLTSSRHGHFVTHKTVGGPSNTLINDFCNLHSIWGSEVPSLNPPPNHQTCFLWKSSESWDEYQRRND